jgi:hypothetical protein
MSAFRKLGRNFAQAFRKLPNDVNVIGRKISNTSNEIQKGIDKVQSVVNRVESVAPNPILKLAKTAIGGVSDVNKSVGYSGQALRSASAGDIENSVRLGRQALQSGTSGVTSLGGVGATLLAL